MKMVLSTKRALQLQVYLEHLSQAVLFRAADYIAMPMAILISLAFRSSEEAINNDS